MPVMAVSLFFIKHYMKMKNVLRAVCCKDQLRSRNKEKTDFPKLCQNKGLVELEKIHIEDR